MLSILPDGRIAFNAAATRLLQKEGVKAVTILWDKARCAIALQASEKRDRNAYSIFFNRGRSATISPKAFLTQIGWSAKTRQTVPTRWNPEAHMIEAELPSESVATYQPTTANHGKKTRM